MLAFLLNRLFHALLVVFVVSVLAFILGDVVGDPVASILGLDATPADRLALRTRLHLDEPAVLRYLYYVQNLLHGDLGVSYAAQRPVSALLAERIPATVELAAVALTLSLAIGVPLGVYAAVKRRQMLANALMTLSVLGVSLPTFVVGILLIFCFSLWLGWLPSFGRGEVVTIGFWTTGFLTPSGLKSLIMPALSLAIGQIALVARLSRAEMLNVLKSDYIRFARARGLKNRAVYFSHALRNTLIPIITVSGIQLGYLVAFAVVVEQVFQWPGMGLLFLQALGQTDLPVISAFLMVAALFFVGINLVVDLLYAVADPRLRIKTLSARS
ncbi:ABC transporter permease [Chelatococcus asaccharovorans]|uniref:ABC transporter permease n=1 Tax=Chelatococcus asaccharovorans TaxID=28210 RepID=UPI00224C71C4|nr:ABC transporter permease [Chelatococcus asaccharovorans]CAH1653459.1 putative peptide transport system permease protein BAB2_1050 [Chelatococcus asaccharovorans]CAH1694134.1 putative peptide transport system permease protein BAB2_1050 [Chelatococcus asaccharovorans]